VKIAFTSRAWEDYLHWQGSDRTIVKRINRLIEDTLRTPFAGIGKPEPLRHTGPDVWSRRLTEEHRLLYLIEDDQITIIQARYHY
jgi:toxin YoeB